MRAQPPCGWQSTNSFTQGSRSGQPWAEGLNRVAVRHSEESTHLDLTQLDQVLTCDGSKVLARKPVVAALDCADAGRRTCKHFAEMAVRVRSGSAFHRVLRPSHHRTSNQGTHAHPQFALAATRLRSES